jgi:hypothetical protein
MPIVARQPEAGPPNGSRSGDARSIGRYAPPVDLLPPGGVPVAVSAPTPQRALALDALRVLRHLRDHPRDAGSWGEPAFAREVDLVRRHLAPIASRRALSSSYAREAFQGPGAAPEARPGRVAYAVRWLELGDGRSRPGWSELVTERA